MNKGLFELCSTSTSMNRKYSNLIHPHQCVGGFLESRYYPYVWIIFGRSSTWVGKMERSQFSSSGCHHHGRMMLGNPRVHQGGDFGDTICEWMQALDGKYDCLYQTLCCCDLGSSLLLGVGTAL